MDVRINKEVAEQVVAKFTPAAAEAYCQNLVILRNACKKFADESNAEGAKQTYEMADKLCKNAEATYPELFTKVNQTVSAVLDMYNTVDTM